MDHASDTSLLPEQGGVFHLDTLINHWNHSDKHESYYLSEHLPSLMLDPSSGDDLERRILTTLKSRLTEYEWMKLPDIAARRKKGVFTGFAIDRDLAEKRRNFLQREQEAKRQETAAISYFHTLLCDYEWCTFDRQLLNSKLPSQARTELIALKERISYLRSLLCDYRWSEFDQIFINSQLPPQARTQLIATKARKMEEERTAIAIRQQRAIVAELHSLLESQKWAEFDERLLKAELPSSARRELSDLKAAKLERSRKEEARQKQLLVIKEIRSLIAQRNWALFDSRLAEAQIDHDERENLLREKAEALTSRLPVAFQPDKHQARILASPGKTIRVTARAGSGKTRLLTALTYFLIEGYGYAPDEILLLAFNKKAAAEIEERLTKLLKIPAFPGARTFHALAYGVTKPEQDVLYDEGNSVATKAHSALIQDILVGLLDDDLLDHVYDLFRRETAEAKETGAFLQGADSYAFRRGLTQYALGGQQVKSRGEKFIADFLFEHGITYAYERPTRWEGGWYRPDFTIKVAEKTWIVWEHWAVDPDAPKVTASADWTEQKLRAYQASAKRKREFWSANNIPLIESCAENCGDREAFEAEIAAKLRPIFPKIERRPKDQLIADMKEIHLSKLSGWVGQAIQRAQKRGWDAARLRNELESHFAETERERLFLELVKQVFTAYEPRLQNERKTDFDRLFNEAIRLMRADPPQSILHGKQTTIDLRDLRICLVDEAQDLSPQFIEAVTCLRELNPRLRLLFVGDDWQAINRFAGSDVELFTDALTIRFGKCATPTLATNYRSVCKVVLAGNALMRGQGSEAVPHKEITGSIQLAYLDQVFVEGREGQECFDLEAPFREFGGSLEKFFKALYQLTIADLQAGKTIGVLFRTNQHMGKSLVELEKQFVRVVRKMKWPREDVDQWRNKLIRFSTAHGFKGLECHTVFVVNPSAGSFPLLNAESIELFRFFGDSLEQAEQDERRLFYVAITRAEERLVFLTEKRKEEESPYLESFRDLIDVISVPSQVILPPSATKPEEAPSAEEDRSEEREEIIPPWEALDSNQP